VASRDEEGDELPPLGKAKSRKKELNWKLAKGKGVSPPPPKGKTSASSKIGNTNQQKGTETISGPIKPGGGRGTHPVSGPKKKKVCPSTNKQGQGTKKRSQQQGGEKGKATEFFPFAKHADARLPEVVTEKKDEKMQGVKEKEGERTSSSGTSTSRWETLLQVKGMGSSRKKKKESYAFVENSQESPCRKGKGEPREKGPTPISNGERGGKFFHLF